MLPGSFVYYIANGGGIDAVLFGEIGVASASGCSLPDGNYLVCRETCVPMLFASAYRLGVGPTPHSALGKHVSHVVDVGTKEKVIRSYARRIVATVENVHAVRDGTIVQFPRVAVGEAVFVPRQSECTIAMHMATRPEPTAIGTAPINKLPEPDLWCDGLVTGSAGASAVFRDVLAASVRVSVPAEGLAASLANEVEVGFCGDDDVHWLTPVLDRVIVYSSVAVTSCQDGISK